LQPYCNHFATERNRVESSRVEQEKENKNRLAPEVREARKSELSKTFSKARERDEGNEHEEEKKTAQQKRTTTGQNNKERDPKQTPPLTFIV
jgi:hypothetical protein